MIVGLAYLILGQAKLAPAVFADGNTKKIVEQSRGAFTKLRSAVLTISSSGETKTYTYSNGKMAGRQSNVKWKFENRKFLVSCPKGLFQGKMGPYSVNAWLAKAGAPNTEVLPVQLMAKKNPIDVLVAPGSRVRKAGAMNVGGVWVDLVEVKSARLRVSMGIRRDNHLFATLSAVNVDKDGKTLFSSQRSMKWASVNGAVSGNAFQISGGKTPKSIRLLK